MTSRVRASMQQKLGYKLRERKRPLKELAGYQHEVATLRRTVRRSLRAQGFAIIERGVSFRQRRSKRSIRKRHELAVARQNSFMTIGPVSPLSFAGTPIFLNVFN